MIRCWPPPPGQRRDGNPGQVGRRRASWCPAATDRPGVLDPALLRPGRREGSNVLLPAEKHAVAVHESGHALVAALAEHAGPVREGDDPARRADARRHRAAAAGRTAYVRRGLPARLPRRAPRRPGGRARRPRPGLGQGSTGARPGPATTWPGPPTRRSRWSASPACHRRSGRSGTRRRFGVPRRRRAGHVQPVVAEANQAAIDGEVSKLLRQAESRRCAGPSDPPGRT